MYSLPTFIIKGNGSEKDDMIITFMISDHDIDLKVEKTQKIIDVIRVLVENMSIPGEILQLKFAYSKRKDEKINVYLTFEQAEIYNGDLLEIKG